MRRDRERNSVTHFRENPAEVAVPSVTMNEVGVDIRSVEINATPNGAEDRLERFRTGEITRIEFVSLDRKAAVFEILISETANIDIDCFCQFACEITNVHSGASINVRRIFVREEKDFHVLSLNAPSVKRTQF
jgi:hypothetical protein